MNEELEMTYAVHSLGSRDIAVVETLNRKIDSPSDFLDLMGNLPARGAVLEESMVSEEFFDLSSRLAGEILQKAVNYDFRLALVGDFGRYESKSLRAFIGESNRGGHILFVPRRDEALKKWS